MRIESISAKIPSLKISNAQIMSKLEEYNQDQPSSIVKRYQKQVSFLLKRAGSRTRYIRDRAKNETAMTFIKSAIYEALQKADLKKSEIDLTIFCGVGRGFLEPANAYFIADSMGMNCQCFDVIDACMSWVRSLEIAYHFLKNEQYRNIMIINAEFTCYEYGYPDVFKIKSLEQIDYTFPAYTIGEATTATVLSKSDYLWSFDYESAPDLANLCTIPMKGYEEFCNGYENIGLNGIDVFVSFGIKLFNVAIERMVTLIKSTVKDMNEPKIWIPHAAALNASIEAAKILNIKLEKLYSKVFPIYGNVASASIPLAISMAINERKLIRGNRVVLTPASAGMAFGVVQFNY